MKYRYENCAVINVVDGDTIDCIIQLGFYMTTVQRFRLNRIDAYESRTRDKEEKVKGLKGKEFLKELIEGQSVILESDKTGKFGRWLAEVYIKDQCINDLLVEEGHAVYKTY